MQGSRKEKFRGGMLVAHACTKASIYSDPILQLHKIIQLETRLELTLFWYNPSCFITYNVLFVYVN